MACSFRRSKESFASHLPIMIEKATGSHGCLIGHMARANPQWQQASGQRVLTIFSGPHAYISPTWYEAEQVVPTWNYAAVHVYGNFQLIEDPADLLKIAQATVAAYEKGLPTPWSFDGSSKFVERMLTQIVGFRIQIEKIEGKWKLNQNHSVERRKKVIQALRTQDGENPQAVATLMQATLPSEG